MAGPLIIPIVKAAETTFPIWGPPLGLTLGAGALTLGGIRNNKVSLEEANNFYQEYLRRKEQAKRDKQNFINYITSIPQLENKQVEIVLPSDMVSSQLISRSIPVYLTESSDTTVTSQPTDTVRPRTTTQPEDSVHTTEQTPRPQQPNSEEPEPEDKSSFLTRLYKYEKNPFGKDWDWGKFWRNTGRNTVLYPSSLPVVGGAADLGFNLYNEATDSEDSDYKWKWPLFKGSGFVYRGIGAIGEAANEALYLDEEPNQKSNETVDTKTTGQQSSKPAKEQVDSARNARKQQIKTVLQSKGIQ